MRSNHLNEIMTVDNPTVLSHVPGRRNWSGSKLSRGAGDIRVSSGESLFLLKMLLGQATF